RQLVTQEGDTKELEKLLRSLALVTLDARREEGAQAELPDGHDHVLQHGHVLEDASDLECPGNAQLDDLVRAKPDQHGFPESHVTLIRAVNAGHAIEQRRLAR